MLQLYNIVLRNNPVEIIEIILLLYVGNAVTMTIIK